MQVFRDIFESFVNTFNNDCHQTLFLLQKKGAGLILFACADQLDNVGTS